MLDETFLGRLTEIVGENAVLDAAGLEGRDHGFHPDNLAAGYAAFPTAVDQVAEIVGLCRDAGVAIVPHGGLTGLAGGAASAPGQLIVSTTRLKGDVEIDPTAATARVWAGSTLEELESAANGHGLSAGIDIAARGTATLGGMIATNAGGSEAFRNGTMRARVLGLEAVCGDGRVMSELKTVTKANEGLDVRQLFIGSEGILGLITRATLRLERLVEPDVMFIVSCGSASEALTLMRAFQACLPCDLRKAEIMWQRYAVANANELGLSAVLPNAQSPVHVIFEAAATGVDADDLLDRMAEILDDAGCHDVIVAQSERERADIWRIREDSFAVERHFPHGFWFDVSVPLDRLDEYVSGLEERLKTVDGKAVVLALGHLGDGNLHLTVALPEPDESIYPQVCVAVFDGLVEAGGSFSAEHGIGLEKKAALANLTDPVKLSLMARIKQVLDPDGIMNPGKVL